VGRRLEGRAKAQEDTAEQGRVTASGLTFDIGSSPVAFYRECPAIGCILTS